MKEIDALKGEKDKAQEELRIVQSGLEDQLKTVKGELDMVLRKGKVKNKRLKELMEEVSAKDRQIAELALESRDNSKVTMMEVETLRKELEAEKHVRSSVATESKETKKKLERVVAANAKLQTENKEMTALIDEILSGKQLSESSSRLKEQLSSDKNDPEPVKRQTVEIKVSKGSKLSWASICAQPSG